MILEIQTAHQFWIKKDVVLLGMSVYHQMIRPVLKGHASRLGLQFLKGRAVKESVMVVAMVELSVFEQMVDDK